MSESIKAVIFDWDGVVADSAQLQVEAEQTTARAMAEELGIDLDLETYDWSEFEGWGRTLIAKRIFNADDELAEEYRERVVETTVDILGPHNLTAINGVRGFIQLLKARGVPLGVATSSNRAILEPSLKLLGMQDDFRAMCCHREALDDKPLPGQYRFVMNKLGVEPEQTLIIEDSKSGIEAGVAARGLVLAIATTKSSDYLRDNTRAHLVVDNYRHAAHLLQPYLP